MSKARLTTHPIGTKCPKMKNQYLQGWGDKGFAAAKAGKPLSALEDEGDTTWMIAERFAWINGWEYGGGCIHRNVVVTQVQRWQEERENLLERIAELDEKLSVNTSYSQEK